MTTLTLTLAILALTAGMVWAWERARQLSRRRDRQIVRRIQRYLDQLPPARPW